MKYLLLVCWDAERMNAQAEPEPGATPADEGFPWLNELRERGAWVIGDQLAPPRRGTRWPRSGRSRCGRSGAADASVPPSRGQVSTRYEPRSW